MTCQNRPILEFTKDNTQRQMAISWAVIPAIPQAEAKQAGRGPASTTWHPWQHLLALNRTN